MSKNKEAERGTWKVPEAAAYAGCGPAAIYRGIAKKRIPHIRFGRLILIPRAAFIRWIESCGTEK